MVLVPSPRTVLTVYKSKSKTNRYEIQVIHCNFVVSCLCNLERTKAKPLLAVFCHKLDFFQSFILWTCFLFDIMRECHEKHKISKPRK